MVLRGVNFASRASRAATAARATPRREPFARARRNGDYDGGGVAEEVRRTEKRRGVNGSLVWLIIARLVG